MQNELIRYIRDEDHTPYGVVVAQKIGNVIRYGYSIRNKKDKWDKHIGVKIALARANASSYILPKGKKNHDAILDNLSVISDRAARYFKNCEVAILKFEV